MRKTPKPNIARILYDAYPDSDLLPLNVDRDCRNLESLCAKVRSDDFGDLLFQFLVTEIGEGGEGTLEGAVQVVERAREDLEAVLQALLSAKAELSEESFKDADRAVGSPENHLRIWRCLACRRAVYRTLRKTAKIGPPLCPGCGRAMQLA